MLACVISFNQHEFEQNDEATIASPCKLVLTLLLLSQVKGPLKAVHISNDASISAAFTDCSEFAFR